MTNTIVQRTRDTDRVPSDVLAAAFPARNAGAKRGRAWQPQTSATPPPPERDPEALRSERWRRRRTLWKWASSSTRANCGRKARSKDVELVATRDGDGQRRGHVRGTISCKSVWACPVCSAMIRKGRQEELQAAAEEWEKRGGTVWLLTLTLRHQRGEKLADLLDVLYESWARTSRGNPWRKRMARFGIEYWVRATEVTYGQANGWHPHLHLVLFVGFPEYGPWRPGETPRVATGDLQEPFFRRDGVTEHFVPWLEDRWMSRLGSLGRSAARGIGVDVKRIASDAVGYIVADGESKAANKAALEAFRGDLKSASGDRLVPFQLLDRLGDIEAELLWAEYETATAGRKMMGRSETLYEDMGVTECTDDELTESDVTDDDDVEELHTDLLPARHWLALCDHGLDHAAVVAYGFSGLQGVHDLLVDQCGVILEPPDDAERHFTPLVLAGELDPSPLAAALDRRAALDAAATRLIAWVDGGDPCTR